MYGGMDGIITTFVIITGSFGAGFGTEVIIVLGLASLVSDAFSMASSNYVSQRSVCHLSDSEDCKNHLSFKTALATFLSFLLAGIGSILPFILALRFEYFEIYAFQYSLVITFSLFFLLGYVEGNISNQSPLKTGARTLLVGAIAAAVAYLIGSGLESLIN